MTVTATYTDGSTRDMPEVHAKVLMQIGRVSGYKPVGYVTRDMRAIQPVEVQPYVPEVSAQAEPVAETSVEAPAVEEAEAEDETPRRRGRPRKVQTEE